MQTGRDVRCNANAMRKNEPGPILLLVACSVNSPVATIGFVHPNLLRFSRGVWCAWGPNQLESAVFVFGTFQCGCTCTVKIQADLGYISLILYLNLNLYLSFWGHMIN